MKTEKRRYFCRKRLFYTGENFPFTVAFRLEKLWEESQKRSYLILDIRESTSEYFVSHGFPTKRFSNNHKTMTHNHHLVDLQWIKKRNYEPIKRAPKYKTDLDFNFILVRFLNKRKEKRRVKSKNIASNFQWFFRTKNRKTIIYLKNFIQHEFGQL